MSKTREVLLACNSKPLVNLIYAMDGTIRALVNNGDTFLAGITALTEPGQAQQLIAEWQAANKLVLDQVSQQISALTGISKPQLH
jgi:hypothetical protein